jgi:hypothetical protein
MGQGVRQLVADKLLQRCCTLSAASRQRSAERGSHMTEGVRWSLCVTHHWRSAERAACSHGEGHQADLTPRQAATACLGVSCYSLPVQTSCYSVAAAMLHTTCRQRSAERGLPHDSASVALSAACHMTAGASGKAVTACDPLLAKRGVRSSPAWGRAYDRWWQTGHISVAAHYLLPACHMTAGVRRSLRVTHHW